MKKVKDFEQEVLNSGGDVFVDFSATWCAPCKTMSERIDEFLKDNPEVYFLKVDVEDVEDIAHYNIRSIPTLIKFVNGEEKARVTGLITVEEIADFVF